MSWMKFCKKSCSFSLGALLVANSASAIPDTLSYVAAIEENGQPFSGNVAATFALFEAATGGTALWDETQTSAIVLQGQLVAELGASASDPLDDSVLQRDALYLQVTIDGETLEPRLPIRAVPYARVAQRALDADAVGGLTADDIATNADVDALGTTIRGETIPFSRITGAPAAPTFATLTGVPADLLNGDQVGPTYLAGGGVGITDTNVISINVASAQIVDGTITSADILNSTITRDDILDSTITTDDVLLNTLIADDIAANAIGTSEIALNVIAVDDIGTGAVGSDEIIDGSITSSDIAGNEIEVYGRPRGCARDGYISLASGGTCPFVNQPCLFGFFSNCAGCQNLNFLETTCDNVIVGKLIAP